VVADSFVSDPDYYLGANFLKPQSVGCNALTHLTIMNNQNWTNTKEEKTELNGEVISRKVISQPSKKFFGINFDTIELLIKIAGLILILIAVIEYLDKVEAKYQEQIRQHNSDSISTERYREQQLNYSKEQQRLDIQLATQQKEIANNQLNFQTDLDFRRQSLEQGLTSNIKQLYLQKDFEIDKEKRGFYTSALTGTSISMEVLLYKPVNSSAFVQSKESLLYELYPKLGIIGDEAIMQKFIVFKNYLLAYEVIQDAISLSDTLYNLSKEVWSKESSNFDASEKLKYKLNEQARDSLFYRTHRIEIFRNAQKLDNKSDEILLLASNLEGELNNNLSKSVSLIKDTLVNDYQTYAKNVGEFEAILTNYFTWLSDIELTKVYEDKAKYLSSFSNVYYIDKKNTALKLLLKELSNKLKTTKSEFDVLMNKKIEFFRQM